MFKLELLIKNLVDILGLKYSRWILITNKCKFYFHTLEIITIPIEA